MIVKNEEDVLNRCLTSIRDAVEEIIIVDTGSQDKTKAIAREFTDKVYDFKWIDDFSAARNYSMSKATKDFIMWLDADDIISEAELVKLIGLKQRLSKTIDMVMMKYDVGHDEDGTVNMSYNRERMFRREAGFVWQEPVHEVVVPSGHIIYEDIHIVHKKEKVSSSNRNIRIYENQIKEGIPLSARGRYYYGRELYYHERFEEAAVTLTTFLQSGEGWIEDCIAATKLVAECYKKTNKNDKVTHMLLQALTYDKPRADISCLIGDQWQEQGEYQKAIFWYDLATKLEKSESGFVYHDYYDYIPYLQLCVCYDKIGNRELAYQYNEKAAMYKPNSPSVAYNRAYFKGDKSEQEERKNI